MGKRKICVRETYERAFAFDEYRYGDESMLKEVLVRYSRGDITFSRDDLIDLRVYVKNWENLKVIFQKGDYTLLNRGTTFEPWVVVLLYNDTTQSWWQGHYFGSFYEAVEFMKTKTEKE